MRYEMRIAALWLGLVLAACAPMSTVDRPLDPTVTAIVGATVVHPQREGSAAAERNQTIITAGNRIHYIGPSASADVPRGATIIDANGKWVVPGLTDGHVNDAVRIAATLHATAVALEM